jgi:hypothetical protein
MVDHYRSAPAWPRVILVGGLVIASLWTLFTALGALNARRQAIAAGKIWREQAAQFEKLRRGRFRPPPTPYRPMVAASPTPVPVPSAEAAVPSTGPVIITIATPAPSAAPTIPTSAARAVPPTVAPSPTAVVASAAPSPRPSPLDARNLTIGKLTVQLGPDPFPDVPTTQAPPESMPLKQAILPTPVASASPAADDDVGLEPSLPERNKAPARRPPPEEEEETAAKPESDEADSEEKTTTAKATDEEEEVEDTSGPLAEADEEEVAPGAPFSTHVHAVVGALQANVDALEVGPPAVLGTERVRTVHLKLTGEPKKLRRALVMLASRHKLTHVHDIHAQPLGTGRMSVALSGLIPEASEPKDVRAAPPAAEPAAAPEAEPEAEPEAPEPTATPAPEEQPLIPGIPGLKLGPVNDVAREAAGDTE